MSSDGKDVALATIHQQHFRRVCSKFATGITVVTLTRSDGSPMGLTVNSFTSVSLEPPLILVCLDLRTSALQDLGLGAAFAINVLSEDQRELSERFARFGENDRFEGIEWVEGEAGAPLLDGVLATVECTVVRRIEAGDHEIVIGEAQRASWHDGTPLVYFNSGYQALKMVDEAAGSEPE